MPPYNTTKGGAATTSLRQSIQHADSSGTQVVGGLESYNLSFLHPDGVDLTRELKSGNWHCDHWSTIRKYQNLPIIR